MREVDIEQEKTRLEVAAFLRDFAEELEKGNRVTLIVGNESATVNPPEMMHFKFASGVDSSWIGTDEGQTLRLELGWQLEDEPHSDELSVVKTDHPGVREGGQRTQNSEEVSRTQEP